MMADSQASLTPPSQAGEANRQACGDVHVSVIIATRNNPRFIYRALRSILEGTRIPEEVIVCDQSTDDTTQLEVERAAAEPFGDRIRYEHFEARGLSRNRNEALVRAIGGFVASADDDIVAAPDWLERMLEEWDKNWQRGSALITGRVLPNPKFANDALVTALRTDEHRWILRGKRRMSGVLIGAQWGIDRALLTRLGECPFDPDMGIGTALPGADDDEFAYRVLRLGVPVVYEPSIEVTHYTQRPGGWRVLRYTRAIGSGAAIGKHVLKGDISLLGELLRLTATNAYKGIKATLARREPEGSARLLAALGLWVGVAKYLGRPGLWRRSYA